MQVKVQESQGMVLDYLVAKAIFNDRYSDSDLVRIAWGHKFSTNWTNGGPIIERECIAVCFESDWEVPNWNAWRTDIDDRQGIMGETPLVAAMRCFVVSKLGNTFDIPDELY